MWKDTSSFSQGDKLREPRTWTYRAGDFRIVVSRHIHFDPDQWILTCTPFFDQRVLRAKDPEVAKEEALNLMRVAIREVSQALEQL